MLSSAAADPTASAPQVTDYLLEWEQPEAQINRSCRPPTAAAEARVVAQIDGSARILLEASLSPSVMVSRFRRFDVTGLEATSGKISPDRRTLCGL